MQAIGFVGLVDEMLVHFLFPIAAAWPHDWWSSWFEFNLLFE